MMRLEGRYLSMRRRTLSLLLLFALVSAPGSPVRAQSLSLREYRALIASARRAAEAGLTPEQARTLQERLRRVRTVKEPDGRQIAVDNRELTRTLARAAAAGRGAARRKAGVEAAGHLRTLDQALNGRTAPPAASDPRQQALRILATSEFRRAFETARPKSWLEKQWDRIGKAIADFLERLFGGRRAPAGGGALLGQAILFILYFLAAVAAAFALYGLWTVVKDRRAKTRRTAGTGLDLSAEDVPDPLGAARERAAAGDYRAAVRLTYIACLRRLHGAGLLYLANDRTNWEYQRMLRGRSPEAADTLLPVTRLFDRVWYGHAPATREEYERAAAAHDALPSAPEQRPTHPEKTPAGAGAASEGRAE